MTTPHPLHDIPDVDLLVQLKTLVGRSNQLTASVLAHLAEVEARGIYRDLACSSLYAYCVYELRMSEDEAQRRIIAARAVRRFPVLLELLETAAIHLTGIVLLAPHLTEENHERLLAAARYRSKREIQKLVATVAPRPDMPARVEPLAPEPRPGRATWAAFLESLSGGVRDLPCGTGPGEAPWAGPGGRIALSVVDRDLGCSAGESHAPARVDVESTGAGASASMVCAVDRDALCSAGGSPAPARVDAGHPVPDLRYKVQFTASENHVRLLEEARNLLQHRLPDRDIARVHELAMEALVAKLRKRRCAGAARPQPQVVLEGAVADTGDGAARPQPQAVLDAAAGTGPAVARPTKQTTGPVDRDGALDEQMTAPVNRDGALDDRDGTPNEPAREPGATSAAMQSGRGTLSRYITAAVERAVWQRDGRQCTFVDHRGQRCRERSGLQLHHREAYWRGGAQTVDNLTLHCAAHNRLMAERELGREYVRARIEARRSGGAVPS